MTLTSKNPNWTLEDPQDKDQQPLGSCSPGVPRASLPSLHRDYCVDTGARCMQGEERGDRIENFAHRYSSSDVESAPLFVPQWILSFGEGCVLDHYYPI